MHIWCVISRDLGFLDVIDDESVLEMFNLHENDLIINLHLLDINIFPPPEVNNIEGNNYGADQVNLGIQDNAVVHLDDMVSNREDYGAYGDYDSSSYDTWTYHLKYELLDIQDDDEDSLCFENNSDAGFSDFRK